MTTTQITEKTPLSYKGKSFPGYTIRSNGDIFGPFGTKLTTKKNGISVQPSVNIIDTQGKQKYLNVAVAVLENFMNIQVHGGKVGYKDGNPDNVNIDNLYVMNRKRRNKKSQERVNLVNETEVNNRQQGFDNSDPKNTKSLHVEPSREAIEDFIKQYKETRNDYTEVVVLDVECPYKKAIKRLEELGLNDIRRNIRSRAIKSLSVLPQYTNGDITKQEIELVKAKTSEYDFTSFPMYTSESIYALHIEHGDILPLFTEESVNTIAFCYMRKLQAEGYVETFVNVGDRMDIKLYDSLISLSVKLDGNDYNNTVVELIKVCNMIKRINPATNVIGLPF